MPSNLWLRIPTIIVTVLYYIQAGAFLWTGDWQYALIFFSYACANIGLLLSV